MNRNRIGRIAIWLLLWGAALSARAGAGLPEEVRIAAALGALLLLPGWWIAERLKAESPARVLLPLSYGLTHGLLALSVVLFHLVRFPIDHLVWPLFLLGLGTAILAPPERSRERDRTGTAVLLLIVAVLVLFSGPRTGFWTDTYDHVGTVRVMAAGGGDPFPGEYFHADRNGIPDPRKGTNHTAFALACRVAGVDPAAGSVSFWAVHVLLLLAAFFWLAESVLGGRGMAWTATILLLILFRGGPAGEWLHTAAYPGKAGITLYFTIAALSIEMCRRGTGRRGELAAAAILGAGAGGVHAFSAILSITAVAVFAAGLFLHRRLRRRAGVALVCLAAIAAGCAPLVLFRALETYDPANPIHLHRQGVLLLPGGLSVIEPLTLFKAVGFAGIVSYLFLPFVLPPGKGIDTGTVFLLAASIAVLLVIANPFLFPFLESRGGYLMRRFPLLAPSSLLFAAVLRRGWAGRRRAAALLPALAAVAVILFSLQTSLANARSKRPLPFGGPEHHVPWTVSLREAADAVPPGATVLTDPVTGYTLFGIDGVHTVGVIDQHSSPNDPNGARRLADSQRFLRYEMSDGEADAILERWNVDYVLFNNMFPSEFRTWNAYIHPGSFRRGLARVEARPDRFEPVESPDGIRLFRVGGRAAPLEEKTRRADPSIGGPARSAAMPAAEIVLLEARLETKSASPGEGIWLGTRWEMTGEEAGAVPLVLFVRAGRTGAERGEKFSLRRKPGEKPWGKFPLGGSAAPYLLWQRGDRVLDRHFFRVPRGCPPGAYEVEVTVDPARFFPVRKLSGLDRGAVREGWTVIDTLEVLR